MVAHILIFIYYFVFAWFQQICIKWLLYEVIWLGIHQRHLQMSNNLMEKRIINHWLKCKAEWNKHEMKAPIKVHRYRKEGQIISDWGSIWLDLESREWSWWAMKEGVSGHLGPREHHWLRVRLLEVCGSLMGKRKEYCACRNERHSERRESWKDIWGQVIYDIVKVAQSCLTLCDPMDYTVHGVLQARILEWVAFPFSRGSSQPRDQTQVSHTVGRFFTNWAIRKVQIIYNLCLKFLLK